jgi:hypothetical protein
LLHFGTSALGAKLLGVDALTYAARSLISLLTSSGSGQDGYTGDNYGPGYGGFVGNYGYYQAPVLPACAAATYWQPGFGWATYCAPYVYYPASTINPAYGGAPDAGYNGYNGFNGNYGSAAPDQYPN